MHINIHIFIYLYIYICIYHLYQPYNSAPLVKPFWNFPIVQAKSGAGQVVPLKMPLEMGDFLREDVENHGKTIGKP